MAARRERRRPAPGGDRRSRRPGLPLDQGERHQDRSLPPTRPLAVDRQPAQARARAGGLALRPREGRRHGPLRRRPRAPSPATTATITPTRADHGDGGGHHFEGPPFEFDASYDADPDQPYRWGMTIDNDKCTGCSACIAACYIENNVSIVGEEQAIKPSRDDLAPHRALQRRRRGRLQRRCRAPPDAGRRDARREQRASPADALSALWCGALRGGLPGHRDLPQRRRHQRHGLQPLCRHALLRQQLHLQGPPVQLLRLRSTRTGPDCSA